MYDRKHHFNYIHKPPISSTLKSIIFRSFFSGAKNCRSDAGFRPAAARAFRVLIFGLSTTYPHCPPHAYKYQFDFCAFHTISCNRNQHYPQSVDNLVDNFRFCCVQPVGISNFSSIYAMYNVYISFPDFTHFGFSSPLSTILST